MTFAHLGSKLRHMQDTSLLTVHSSAMYDAAYRNLRRGYQQRASVSVDASSKAMGSGSMTCKYYTADAKCVGRR